MRPSALAAGVYYGRPERERIFGGLTLCRTVYAPLARLPAHAHDAAYLCLALSGGFEERTGASEVRVVAGSAVLHRPGEMHADRFDPRRSSCLNVSFAPEWLARTASWIGAEARPEYAPPPAVGALVRRAEREFDEPDDASELVLEALTLELLAFFARAQRGERGSAPSWMARTLELLEHGESVSLTELAHGARVHPSTLVRTFRRVHGCSPGEYRRRRRIERACEMLRAGDAPLAEIAARAGFADQSHFTRALRAALGCAPAAYRRKLRGR